VTRRTRKAVLLAAVGLAGAAALYGAMRGEERPPAAPSRPVSATPVAPTPDSAAPPRSAAAEPLDPAALDSAIQAIPTLGRFGADAARDYRQRARFPPWSSPLPDSVDPLVRDRRVIPGSSLPRDLLPVLQVAPDQSTYVDPASVRVRATLYDDAGPVEPRDLSGEVRDSQGRSVAELEFVAADAGAYEATLDVAALTEEPLRGAYLISVRAVSANGDERNAAAGFLYSVPGAALSGRYRDAVVDGDLLVEAELEVFSAARFHVEATLADAAGVPIAWAQAAGHYDEGLAWLPLTFYGLVLREHGAGGPYRLASIALTTVDGMPNQKSDLVRDAHVTRPYSALDFHADPFDDPDLLRAAEQLEGR
jgi:hypothetical protein